MVIMVKWFIVVKMVITIFKNTVIQKQCSIPLKMTAYGIEG